MLMATAPFSRGWTLAILDHRPAVRRERAEFLAFSPVSIHASPVTRAPRPSGTETGPAVAPGNADETERSPNRRDAAGVVALYLAPTLPACASVNSEPGAMMVKGNFKTGYFWTDRRAAQLLAHHAGLDDDDWINAQQLSTWLWISARRLQRWRRRGEGPRFIRVYGETPRPRCYYRAGDVRAWLRERAALAPSQADKVFLERDIGSAAVGKREGRS